MPKRRNPNQTQDNKDAPETHRQRLDEAGESTIPESQEIGVQAAPDIGPSVEIQVSTETGQGINEGCQTSDLVEAGGASRTVEASGVSADSRMVEAGGIISEVILKENPISSKKTSQKRGEHSSGPLKKYSPRPGPSSAAEGTSSESIVNIPMLHHLEAVTPPPDSSSQCSSETRYHDFDNSQSMEDTEEDDSSSETFYTDTSSDDPEYTLD